MSMEVFDEGSVNPSSDPPEGSAAVGTPRARHVAVARGRRVGGPSRALGKAVPTGTASRSRPGPPRSCRIAPRGFALGVPRLGPVNTGVARRSAPEGFLCRAFGRMVPRNGTRTQQREPVREHLSALEASHV